MDARPGPHHSSRSSGSTSSSISGHLVGLGFQAQSRRSHGRGSQDDTDEVDSNEASLDGSAESASTAESASARRGTLLGGLNTGAGGAMWADEFDEFSPVANARTFRRVLGSKTSPAPPAGPGFTRNRDIQGSPTEAFSPTDGQHGFGPGTSAGHPGPHPFDAPSDIRKSYPSDLSPAQTIQQPSSSSYWTSVALSPSVPSISTQSPPSLLIPRRDSETRLAIRPSPPAPQRPFPASSSSSSSSGAIHNRNVSLTSACPPASSPDKKYAARAARKKLSEKQMGKLPSVGDEGELSASRWKLFSWATSNNGSGKKRDEGPSSYDDDRPFRPKPSSPTLSTRPVQRPHSLRDTLSACLGLLSPYLHADSRQHKRATSLSSQRYSHSGDRPSLRRGLSGPTSPTDSTTPGKRTKSLQSRLVRVLILAYIAFSLVYFTTRVTGLAFQPAPPLSYESQHLRSRQADALVGQDADLDEYTQWQRAKIRLAGAYHVAAKYAYDAARLSGLGPKKLTAKEAAGDFGSEHLEKDSEENKALLQKLPNIGRKWASASSRDPANNPLTPFSHQYRFSKLSSKLDSMYHDQIDPFLFRATQPAEGEEVTACLYYNDAWISQLPDFLERWRGPVSLVYEVLGARNASAVRSKENGIAARLRALRHSHPLIKAHVDFHVVYTPQTSHFLHGRARERLITRPVGTNFQLNLARFFARTDLVWLVSDARVLPTATLRAKLNGADTVKALTLDRADAIVVPLFGMVRQDLTGAPLPNLASLRVEQGLPENEDGISGEDFASLAKAYTEAHHATLPIAAEQWPSHKWSLVGLASTHPPASVLPEHLKEARSPVFALYDRHWDAGKGPTRYGSWKKARSSTPTASATIDDEAGMSEEEAEADTDAPAETVTSNEPDAEFGGFYEVTGYDLHYNPSLVVGKDRQPWCTERFEYNRAACSYQMYLQGARMWVLPDEWAFTLEAVEKGGGNKRNEAEKLKAAISTRLYTKFHSEACMHYGRAFLSMDLWDSDRARHLRYSCSHVFASYGIGQPEAADKAAAATGTAAVLDGAVDPHVDAGSAQSGPADADVNKA